MMLMRVVAATAVLGLAGGIATAGAAQIGKASYYKHGSRTANGERFDAAGYTAAHRTLPFGTRVLVTNLDNGKSVIVRINDRGPHTRGRLIDLSLGAAKMVGITAAGVAKVKIVPLQKMAIAQAAMPVGALEPASVADSAAQAPGFE